MITRYQKDIRKKPKTLDYEKDYQIMYSGHFYIGTFRVYSTPQYGA